MPRLAILRLVLGLAVAQQQFLTEAPAKSHSDQKERIMAVMTSRERVLRAVNFQDTDRVPIDLGAMKASGIGLKALHDNASASLFSGVKYGLLALFLGYSLYKSVSNWDFFKFAFRFSLLPNIFGGICVAIYHATNFIHPAFLCWSLPPNTPRRIFFLNKATF